MSHGSASSCDRDRQLINRFIDCTEVTKDDGTQFSRYSWKSFSHFWSAMAEIVNYRKQALLDDEDLWTTLGDVYKEALVDTYDSELAELDFAGVQRQFESATRLMIASYDQGIRTFRAYETRCIRFPSSSALRQVQSREQVCSK